MANPIAGHLRWPGLPPGSAPRGPFLPRNAKTIAQEQRSLGAKSQNQQLQLSKGHQEKCSFSSSVVRGRQVAATFLAARHRWTLVFSRCPKDTSKNCPFGSCESSTTQSRNSSQLTRAVRFEIFTGANKIKLNKINEPWHFKGGRNWPAN